jgi:hypothetical protein
MWDKKSLILNFLKIKIRKTGERIGFQQFGKKIINLHTKLEEYILVSFYSNLCTCSSLAMKK